MKLYADTSVRRTLQILGDLGVVAWVWFWIHIADKVQDAGRPVARVPLVGDQVRSPFDGAGRAALGLVVALIPILVLASYYLPQRITFVRRATAGQRYLDAGADLDLFALRAMTHQPLHVRVRRPA